ncbi:Rrf2 family transcriptional regulator [Paenalcaligenes hominis]|uniref:Rrf2 family transcriptional regulator n=1 Tax=Paenalcaligenes hominis TaxID=643674 RepID=UPI0035257B55
MQLTQYTDYSIRTLLYAAAYADRLVNISEIADYYSISRTHLAKVVAGLTQAGYLQGIRGKNGGLRLSKAPQHINLGELIEKLEPLEIVECFGNKNTCAITVSCQLKHVLHEAKVAFITTLKGYTLADIQLPTPLPVGVEHPLTFYSTKLNQAL